MSGWAEILEHFLINHNVWDCAGCGRVVVNPYVVSRPHCRVCKRRKPWCRSRGYEPKGTLAIGDEIPA